MKRRAATTVLVSLMITITSAVADAPAHGAPVYGSAGDVSHAVRALERQLVEHRGVTVSDRWTRGYVGDDIHYVYLYKKLVEFGKGKVVATDTRYRGGNKHAGNGAFRYLTFPGRHYMQDKNQRLPEGKRWVLEEGKEFVPTANGPIRVTEPAVLRAVLAKAKVKRPAGVYDGTRTTLYEGTITFGELYAASPRNNGGKPTAKDAKREVSWRIWVGSDQLTRRVWSSYRSRSLPSGVSELLETHVMDTLFTGWGAKTDITPPPDDQVIRAEDLDGEE
ncbi:hypothetical protein HII36_20135 [Nonomuraea sp. NN258]|uniref:hypothetical protein n=1 Tax=Nonomuraea antri TaxID=2730852 RepID=UPI001568E8DF|nr:hypothetical protein [Nonomuraea antri]NRQ34143.1 hypothetical protein [Nonomuraea antri]